MASKSVICNLNLNGNQIENAVIQVLSTAPLTPTAGQIYYDSVKTSIGYYNGTSWVYVDAGNVYAIDTIADDTTSTEKTFKIYQGSADTTSGNDTLTTFTLRALKEGTNIALSKTAVASGADTGKEYITISINPSTDNTLGGSSASDSKVPSEKAVKDYVDGQISDIVADVTGTMHYIGVWDGEKTIAENLATTGQAVTELRKGDYWIVSNGVDHADIPVDPTKTANDYVESKTGTYGLEVGDMIICNSDVAAASLSNVTKAAFDVIDNSESPDLVRTGDINTTATLATSSTSTIPSEYTVAQYFAATGVTQYSVLESTANATSKSIAESVHNCGKYPEVKVYQKVDSTYFEEVVAKVAINASGDVTVSWNKGITVESDTAVDPIRIVIIGRHSIS